MPLLPLVTHSGIDALFQDDSCSTFTHDLLCVGDPGAGKHWFMTAAEDWPEVTKYLRTRDGSNTIRTQSISLQELSQAPFNVYFYMQRRGDLVILPPRRLGHPRPLCPPANNLRSFSQKIHRGVTASLRWERMTWEGLKMFIYHDRIFRQRYDDYSPELYVLTPFSVCAEVRYHPHQILCSTVLKLHEEFFNLKRSQSNDPSVLSAKSGTLEEGLKLLDEVIDSSRCSQEELPPIADLTLPPPPCSFCGGELFRTLFCCVNSCVRDGTTGGSVDCKILICSHCFIDGRSCRCGFMKPYRIQPLDDLVELRKNVASLLNLSDENSSENGERSLTQTSSDQDSQGCRVFDVARALCEVKTEGIQVSTISVRYRIPHADSCQ